MDSAANDLFEQIVPRKENREVFHEALEIEELRKSVVDRLAWLQNSEESNHSWWEDRQLMNLFISLHKSNCISLPKDPVERLRWIGLLCVAMSNLAIFDCSTIVIPFDFLPDDMMILFQDEYPKGTLEEVISLRKRLVKEGWDAVFPE